MGLVIESLVPMKLKTNYSACNILKSANLFWTLYFNKRTYKERPNSAQSTFPTSQSFLFAVAAYARIIPPFYQWD